MFNIPKHLFLNVFACVSFICYAYAEPIIEHTDDYKVLSVTRHSMRGVTFLNGQKISLTDNLSLPNPFLRWNYDLTHEGIELVEINCLNECVQAGLDELGLGKWKKEWTEIRVNFLDDRTFLTGKLLKEKMGHSQAKLTAVIDKAHSNELYSFNPVNHDCVVYEMDPGRFPSNVPAHPSRIDPIVLRERTHTFLNWLSLALGQGPFTGNLPDVYIDGKLNPFYSTYVSMAADLIIMSSSSKPSLNRLFKNDKVYPYQKEVVESASKFTSAFLTGLYSMQFITYNSFPVVEYLNRMEFNNTGKILLSHDIRQFQLLAALNLEPFPLNIPFQSYVFIQSKDQICVMYTAPKISEEGTFHQNSFLKKLIWKGTLDEWKAKIQNMTHYFDPIYPLYPIKDAYELIID